MQQKAIGLALALLFASGLFADPSRAQSGALVVPVCGTLPLAYKTGSTRPLTQDVNGNMCSSATAGALTGSTSNATSAVATTATNIPTVSYSYGFNGTTWDQLQVDGSKNLQVNCAVGCSGGSFNNNSDGVATSSTNGQAAGWIYVWNGATWDRAIGTAALGQYVQAKSGAFASGSIASGAIVDLGTQADPAWSSGSGSLIAISKTIATNSGAAVPCFYSTAYNTLSQVNGTTAPAGCDLNGNLYVNLGRYMGTAGTANSAVMSVQGIASMTPFLTTTTLNAETTKVIGTVNQGTSPWVVSNGGTFAVQAALVSTTNAGATVVKGGVGVVNGGSFYETVAASQTAQVLQSSTGATGDYLSHCTVIPTSTSPGVVTILDNSTAIYSFPGGASSLSNLVPWTIPVGAVSASGAWKVTTGSSLSVVCVGKFS